MLIAVGSPLPAYRVRASTNALTRQNLIHDDEFARKCGYRGALVPGASIFGYMAHSLFEMLGREWLERGSAEIRFMLPVYEGEELRVTGAVSSITREGVLCIECQVMNPKGGVCAAGSATLPPSHPENAPGIGSYPPGNHRSGRGITLQDLKINENLNPLLSEFTRPIQWAYCQKIIRDHHPLFQEVIHPGWLLSQAGLILAANYDLSAWIHVQSVVQNYRIQMEECVVETRGRVKEKFEFNGDHYLVLDLALFAGQHCIQTILYTVIFRIAPRAA
jgi:hypothetical protein